MRGLKVANARIRDAILNGVTESGPPTLRSKWARVRYSSPEGLNEAFSEAVKITDAEMKKCENKVSELSKLPQTPETEAKIEALQVKQHFYNPEVHYNHLYKNVDYNLPIFRYLAKRDWSKRDMLVLMQRIEQHHVIPDTLPTIDPRAKVDIKFPTPTARLLEAGEVLASTVTERLPQIKITDFSKEGLYSIFIVNPDVPDIENDTYKSALHFAAVNVPISFSEPLVDVSKSTVLKEYLPPHPEKNLPAQRFCVWALRQPEAIENVNEESITNFNIRDFTASHNLDPVGVQLWRSKWDRYVPILREKHGLGKGSVYYRARTAKPEDSLLHIRHSKKWPQP